MTFIETIHLTKEYKLGKTTVPALRGVNISVEKGEYLCIAGPSGAGKSTFLNIIGLLDRATNGKIMFNGKEIQNLDKKLLADLGDKKLPLFFSLLILFLF